MKNYTSEYSEDLRFLARLSAGEKPSSPEKQFLDLRHLLRQREVSAPSQRQAAPGSGEMQPDAADSRKEGGQPDETDGESLQDLLSAHFALLDDPVPEKKSVRIVPEIDTERLHSAVLQETQRIEEEFSFAEPPLAAARDAGTFLKEPPGEQDDQAGKPAPATSGSDRSMPDTESDTRDQPEPEARKQPRWLKRLREEISALAHTRRIIGLDRSHDSLKYIVLQKKARGYHVVDFGCESFAEINKQQQSADELEHLKLKRLRETLGRKICQDDIVISAVSGLDVIYRVVQVPRMSKKELAEAVPWAVRKDLPFEVEQAMIDFEVLTAKKESTFDKLQVATLATTDEHIQKHVQQFEALHILPAKITSASAAIWNVLLQSDACQEQNILVVEIGSSSSHLVFVKHGVLEFHREITMAGNDIIDAIANSFPLDFAGAQEPSEKALEILKSHDVIAGRRTGNAAEDLPLRDITANVRQVLDRLANEIRRSLDYYRQKYNTTQIDKLLLCGGGALIRSFDAYLAQAVGVRVEILNPFSLKKIHGEKLNDELNRIGPRLVVACGLAIDRRHGLNLLPAKYKTISRVRKVSKIIRYFATAVFVALALSTGYFSLQVRKITSDLSGLQAEYRKLQPIREQYRALSRRQEQLLQKRKAYNAKIFVNTSARDHLLAISNLIPEKIALTSLAIEPVPQEEGEKERKTGIEFVSLRGIVFPDNALEGANLAAFLLELEESGYFQDIEIANQEVQADGTISFVIKCYY